MDCCSIFRCVIVLGVVLLTAASGCTRTSQQERIIPLKASASIDRARSLLENYAKGAPVTSEAEGFKPLVDGVRQEDPATADILAEAFQKIRETPAARAQIAKKALEKLPAAPPADAAEETP